MKRVRESVGKSTGPCALLNQNGDHVNNEIVQFMKKCSPNETNIVALFKTMSHFMLHNIVHSMVLFEVVGRSVGS